jgi:hypothetical protein
LVEVSQQPEKHGVAPSPPPDLIDPTFVEVVSTTLKVALTTSSPILGYENPGEVLRNVTTGEWGTYLSWDLVHLLLDFPVSGLNSGDLIEGKVQRQHANFQQRRRAPEHVQLRNPLKIPPPLHYALLTPNDFAPLAASTRQRHRRNSSQPGRSASGRQRNSSQPGRSASGRQRAASGRQRAASQQARRDSARQRAPAPASRSRIPIARRKEVLEETEKDSQERLTRFPLSCNSIAR